MLILSFLIGFALRFYPEIHMFLRSPLNLIPIEWAQPDVFNALYIMTIKKISKICIVTSKKHIQGAQDNKKQLNSNNEGIRSVEPRLNVVQRFEYSMQRAVPQI